MWVVFLQQVDQFEVAIYAQEFRSQVSHMKKFTVSYIIYMSSGAGLQW